MFRSKILWAVVALAAIAACVLYFHDPMQSAWMPHCWWRQLTGTDCPSCGTLRAGHALMHGRWAEAMAFNPFLLIGVPALGIVAWCEYKNRYHLQRWVITVYVVLYFAWWLLRNLLAQ